MSSGNEVTDDELYGNNLPECLECGTPLLPSARRKIGEGWEHADLRRCTKMLRVKIQSLENTLARVRKVKR